MAATKSVAISEGGCRIVRSVETSIAPTTGLSVDKVGEHYTRPVLRFSATRRSSRPPCQPGAVAPALIMPITIPLARNPNCEKGLKLLAFRMIGPVTTCNAQLGPKSNEWMQHAVPPPFKSRDESAKCSGELCMMSISAQH